MPATGLFKAMPNIDSTGMTKKKMKTRSAGSSSSQVPSRPAKRPRGPPLIGLAAVSIAVAIF